MGETSDELYGKCDDDDDGRLIGLTNEANYS